MRRFSAGGPVVPIWVHGMIVGKHKCGKTWQASTFPKPYFLTSSADHGADTLPGRIDGVEVDTWAEAEQITTEVEQAVFARKWPFDTFVVDCGSFLGEYAVRAEFLRIEDALRLERKGKPLDLSNMADIHALAEKEEKASMRIFKRILAQFTMWIQRIHALPKHTLILMHTTDKMGKDERGNSIVIGEQLDFPGSFKNDLLRLVFFCVQMEYPALDKTTGAWVRRSWLQQGPGHDLACLRRDGHADSGGTLLMPPYIDNMTFHEFSWMLTAVGCPVYGAANLPK